MVYSGRRHVKHVIELLFLAFLIGSFSLLSFRLCPSLVSMMMVMMTYESFIGTRYRYTSRNGYVKGFSLRVFLFFYTNTTKFVYIIL